LNEQLEILNLKHFFTDGSAADEGVRAVGFADALDINL